MLEVEGLNAWYGRSHVLQGVDLFVAAGSIVSLVGRNGAGKTTTLRAIMGLIDRLGGNIRFDGHELAGLPAHRRFGLGLGYVPEERRIVPGLSVRENIRLGLLRAPQRQPEEEVLAGIEESFPRLIERLDQEAVTLSGGEQQMLAIARAMVSRPKMIMLDEPSEGIMPRLVDEMAELFVAMRARGTTILLVEQNVEMALELSDFACIMDQGLIVHAGPARDLLADSAIQERYCSV